MKICIRPHDVGKATAQELGEKIHELGFDGVQLAIAKAIAGQNGSPETLTDAVIQEIRSGFNNNEVDIALLGAYFNPVHSNKQKVFDGQQKISSDMCYGQSVTDGCLGWEKTKQILLDVAEQLSVCQLKRSA